MKRLTTVVIALACGVGAVWADTDPIAERRALMKNDGMAAKKMFDMSKGDHSVRSGDGAGRR